MFSIARLLAVALAAVVVFHAQMATAQSCPAPGNLAAIEAAMGQGVNAVRRSAGLPQLAPEARLTAAAQDFACDMARHNFLSHQGRDRSQPQDRVSRTGYRSCMTAENIGAGETSPDGILQVWTSSAAHRQNMQMQQLRHFGVGVAQGAQGPVWVLVLAAPC